MKVRHVSLSSELSLILHTDHSYEYCFLLFSLLWRCWVTQQSVHFSLLCNMYVRISSPVFLCRLLKSHASPCFNKSMNLFPKEQENVSFHFLCCLYMLTSLLIQYNSDSTRISNQTLPFLHFLMFVHLFWFAVHRVLIVSYRYPKYWKLFWQAATTAGERARYDQPNTGLVWFVANKSWASYCGYTRGVTSRN